MMLFQAEMGQPIFPQTFGQWLKKVQKKHNLSNYTPQSFRHTFATHMLSNGCPLKSVQELLGHASLSSTEIYTHITDDYIKSEYLKNMPRR